MGYGRSSYVDESLFGETRAQKLRKSKLRTAGAGVISRSTLKGLTSSSAAAVDTAPMRMSSYEFNKLRSRARGTDKPKKVPRPRHPVKIGHLKQRQPSVKEEYEFRKRSRGHGPGNERAQRQIDETLDEVKELRGQLDLMAMQGIIQRQINYKVKAKKEQKAADDDWDARAKARNMAALKKARDEEAERKRLNKIHAQDLKKQMHESHRKRILAGERLELEKAQMRAQIQRAIVEDEEKLVRKRAEQAERLQELVKCNKETEVVKAKLAALEVVEDAKIVVYIKERDAKLAAVELEKQRAKKEKEMETARLRALQERHSDKKAEEDARRAKVLVELRNKEIDMAAARKEQEKKEMMDDVLAVRVQQQRWKEEQDVIEKERDMVLARRIAKAQKEADEKDRLKALGRKNSTISHVRELDKLRDRRRHEKVIAKQQEKEKDIRENMDSDVYKYRVGLVLQAKIDAHRKEGFEVPPKLARQNAVDEDARNEERAKFYKSRALW